MSQTTARRPQNEPLAVQVLTARVRSERDPSRSYNVTMPSCECPDFYFKKGSLADPLCKHLKAAMGLKPQGGTRLDEDTAAELLIALKVRPSAAMAALRRAKSGTMTGTSSCTTPDGIAGISYHPGHDVYDIVLPA
jgi:hypothetical protein